MVIFFLVIALGIGLYVYNSGVVGQGISALQSLSPNTSSTGSSTFSFSLFHPGPSYQPSNPASPPGGGNNPSNNTVITSPQNPPLANQAEIPDGFAQGQISPYFHQIRFGVLAPGNNSYAGGQISLYALYVPAGAKIDVTGWEIKGNHGGEFIPQAVNFYDALGLNPPTDIFLKGQDVLNIYGMSAPVNLRLNNCMGYLPNRGQFTPPLPQVCPQVNRNEVQSFTGACQNYIFSLGGCQVADLSNPAVQNDYNCEQYVSSHFNYRSCIDNHQGDPGFLSNEVRVWMGSTPLDIYHDRVELLDQKGLLVDYDTY